MRWAVSADDEWKGYAKNIPLWRERQFGTLDQRPRTNLGQISLGLRMGGTAVQQPTSKASESQSTFSMKVAGLLFNVVLNDNVTSPSILIIRPVEFMGAFLASALIVLGTLRLGRVFNVCLLLAMLISSGFRCCLHWCQIESSLNSKIEFEV